MTDCTYFDPVQIIRSKTLPHIDIKTKENPFCAPYAAKARILVHAHLERFRLRPDTLAVGEMVASERGSSLYTAHISLCEG